MEHLSINTKDWLITFLLQIIYDLDEYLMLQISGTVVTYVLVALQFHASWAK